MQLDLFCKVVDNFGDAGVCWRLARHLVAEEACRVRLWIDDLDCLARIWPEVDPAREAQRCAGVDIRRWGADMPEVVPAEVVVEGFGCRLPDAYLSAMAGRSPAPVWINLEYLTAEEWADGCHALPSPHPRLPLTCHFYFPGFSAATGGLPGESSLAQHRDAFRADRDALADFWRDTLGIDAPAPGTTTISLFCYDNLALPELALAWQRGPAPVRVLVPAGARSSVLAALGLRGAPGSRATAGALSAETIPFLTMDDYDRLLWACDVNFVRGEDSFMRALWAGTPFVWQAYPQPEAAHHAKVAAFLRRYAASCSGPQAAALAAMHRCWNGIDSMPAPDAWTAFVAARPALTAYAANWADQAGKNGFLAKNLASFCRSKLKCRVFQFSTPFSQDAL